MSLTLNQTQCCLNAVQRQFHTIYNEICGLCKTDDKIHALLITGRVLQCAAIAAVAGSCIFAFVAGPLSLVTLVPAVALAILGTYLAENPSKVYNFFQFKRPFIPGQPIGMTNGGNNCWLNSGLQMLAHIPAFHQRMRQIPIFAQFLDAYKASGDGSQKIAPNIDSHLIRQYLSRETGGDVPSEKVQYDAAELFNFLFNGTNGLYRLEQVVDNAPSANDPQPMIQLEIPRGVSNLNFQQLFHGFFDERTDRGQRKQLFFQSPPNDLLIQLKRFYRDRDGTEGKYNDVIQAPETMQLPNQFVRSGQDAAYRCDSFLVHQGTTLDGGHYVAYVKVGDVWWYCSDTNVYEVSSSDAQRAMGQSYILHYAKS